MADDTKLNNDSSTLLADAVNETSKTTPLNSYNAEAFIKEVGKKFIQNKVYDFPKLCDETRRVNWMQNNYFNQMDNPGGWSETRDFKHDYVIPKELYVFMTNLVYRNFWDEDNEKVWRSFMKAIMRGQDALELLRKVKLLYDPEINKYE